ncbi:MAG TPA: TetR/AcrR family transcriptional regulator [Candidatus Binatia bacterium]|nr:TetR/AcrR family transcriptional regulator [Candidatus Binatia bacterium]
MTDRPQQPRPTGARAERTRATILVAAETVFAEKGYAAARLEDVAGRVGVRRASLVYYFRDKRELYDAVLSDIFGELLDRYQVVLTKSEPLPQRIEAIVDTWVGYVAERPAVARLLLWEAADGSQDRVLAAAGNGAAVISTLTRAIQEGQRHGLFHPIDPIHFIFTIVGATVFFVAAMPRMVPSWPFDPLNPRQLAAHRAQLLGISRRLLGTSTTPAEAHWTARGPRVTEHRNAGRA